MDICCGEVTVKSKIMDQSRSSGGGDSAEKSIAACIDLYRLQGNVQELQKQIDDLSKIYGQFSMKVNSEMKLYVNQALKNEKLKKRN